MKRQTIFLIDETKIILLRHINKSPGIRYRELQRATGFANGVLAYHLNILEKSKRIKVIRYRIRKITRYYPLYTTAKESRLMASIVIATLSPGFICNNITKDCPILV